MVCQGSNVNQYITQEIHARGDEVWGGLSEREMVKESETEQDMRCEIDRINE